MGYSLWVWLRRYSVAGAAEALKPVLEHTGPRPHVLSCNCNTIMTHILLSIIIAGAAEVPFARGVEPQGV